MNQNRSKYYSYCIANSKNELDIIRFKHSKASCVEEKKYFAAQLRDTQANIEYFERQLEYQNHLQEFLQVFRLQYPHIEFINIENSTQDTSNFEDSA